MTKHQQLLNSEIERCVSIAFARWGYDAPIAVRWDLRGLVAGTANRTHYLIRLNEHIAKAEGEAYRQTIAHEIAHLVTYWRFRQRLKQPRPHGREWAEVMKAFGCEARRCHQYQSATRVKQRTTYAYHCTGCTAVVNVGPRQHASIVRKQKRYKHAKCGGTIIPKETA